MAWLGGVLWWIVLGALAGWLVAWWIGRSTQRLLTEPVIQIIERTVDNPRHIARIATLEGEAARVVELEAQVATMPAMQARIDTLLAAPPRVVEKVVNRTIDRVIEKPVDRIVEKVVEKPVDRIVEKVVERVVEKVVPDAAAIAERDAALRTERQRVEHLQALAGVLSDRVGQAARPAAVPAPVAAANASGPEPGPSRVQALSLRIEHLEALASVQAARLAAGRDAVTDGATDTGSPA